MRQLLLNLDYYTKTFLEKRARLSQPQKCGRTQNINGIVSSPRYFIP